jgi:uncharacterized protein with GYD domain
MPKYITYMSYSSGSLARMITEPGDRHRALERVIAALGGSLESVYWQLETEDSLTIADLPDSVCAGALNAAIAKTGAFKNVETHELMTQKQMLDILALARDAARVFEVPGQPDADAERGADYDSDRDDGDHWSSWRGGRRSTE